MNDYLVYPNREAEVALALQAFQGALKGQRPVAQLSTPITTGPRYYAWVLERQHLFDLGTEEGRKAARADRRERVYSMNVTDAEVKSKSLYEQFPGYQWINPCHFEPEGWSQNDFISFWGDVMATTCKLVAFNDGWWMSRGCAYEFYTCQRVGIPCIDVHGNYLSREIGTALIMNAMNGYTVIDHSLEIMEEAYTALTHLTNPERTLLPQWQLPAYIKP